MILNNSQSVCIGRCYQTEGLPLFTRSARPSNAMNISIRIARQVEKDAEAALVREALAQLPVNLVFTANYDDLLERAFRDAGKRVEIIVRDNDIPFMEPGQNRVNIVKLYGDLNQPETVVLAKAQLAFFFNRHACSSGSV